MNKKERIYRWRQKHEPWAIKALTRDGNKCVDCGRSDCQIIVHHLDDCRKTGKLNNALDNLISLCRPCHAHRHGYFKTFSIQEGIANMRRAGCSLIEIGRCHDFSRQRVWQILRSLENWQEIEEENWKHFRLEESETV